MTRVNHDTLVAIVLLVGCGVLLDASFDIREPDYGVLSPATWPRSIIAVLTILSLIYLVQSVRRGAQERTPGSEEPVAQTTSGFGEWLAHWRNVFFVFALFLAYLIALPWLGMLVGGVLFVFLLLNALGGWSPARLAVHAAIAAISVGSMWSVFTFGLGVILPRGELFGSF